MKQLILFFMCLNATYMFAQYHPDILGSNFESQTIALADDYEGKAEATLIHRKAELPSKTGILYIHGFNDYFFQENLAEEIHNAGYHFYAIDLRKYGRSLLAHQKRCNVRSLSEYYEEIDQAMDIMTKAGISKVVLNGHSTGGLIVANYLNDRKQDKRIVGAILNSPFLDFNNGWFTENAALPVIAAIGGSYPDTEFPVGEDSNYGKSIHKDYKGEWNFNLKWKTITDTPINLGWIHAINSAQDRVQDESNIQVPVIVFSSDRSYKGSEWDDKIQITDAVLDVEDIQEYGKNLGANVSLEIIPKGKHDLVLSNKEVRDLYLKKMIYWVNKINQ